MDLKINFNVYLQTKLLVMFAPKFTIDFKQSFLLLLNDFCVDVVAA